MIRPEGAAVRLVTDSCCDIEPAHLAEIGVTALPFPFLLDETEYLDDGGATLAHPEFYRLVREGAMPTTAQVRVSDYLAAFTDAAVAGEPLVFLSFSSALSGTFETALNVRDHVIAQHPDARIHVVDTRRASIAQGLLVLEAARHRDAGMSAEALAAWAESARDAVCGYFTLESLEHLARGGRIPDAVAYAGAMLDVRPVLRFSASGALAADRAVRGRSKSLKALVDHWVKEGDRSTLVIGHADCAADAEHLEQLLIAAAPAEKVVHLHVGPVIGSHTGPGMVAVSFMRRADA